MARGEGSSDSQVNPPNLQVSHGSRGGSSLSEREGSTWPQPAVIQDHAILTSPTTRRRSLVTDVNRNRSDRNDDSQLGSSQQQQSVGLQNSGESLPISYGHNLCQCQLCMLPARL